jgi:SSS family solute:Na+ symporter
VALARTMNLAPLDWAICIAFMMVLVVFAIRTTRYTNSVAAFLSANRSGGRYIVAVSKEMAALSVITLVGLFESGYQIGYAQVWWPLMEGPAMIIIALSGWVIYRYRQTRAMTIAQFFEMRYSRSFRVFAGIVAFISGIINFGVFPAIEARFFMALCGLPESFTLAGITIGTFPAIMFLMLALAIAFVFLGGLLAIMVTDCLQGIFCYIAFAIIIGWLLWHFGFDRISQTLLAQPAGHSLVHPMRISGERDFGIWFYVISVIVLFYTWLGWQGAAGYNSAPRNPHEAKMANILAGWRWRVLMLIVTVVPICVHVFLEHPAFAQQAASVNAQLAGMDEATRNSQRAPLVLGAVLPVGLMGITVMTMIALFLSTSDTYLHSWGSILVQDVILPFRKRPFTTRQHLLLLRVAILGVAVFVFCFSMLYTHTQFVTMFLALTGAVFVGGAGSAIIGGLYWSRGTTAGAWAAMITGMTLSAAGIIAKQLPPADHAAIAFIQNFSGQELTLFAILGSIAMYVLVSLLGPRRDFDMDRLLHRGKYAVRDDQVVGDPKPPTVMEKLGFTREFSGRDRVITYITLAWPLAWTAIFIGVTIYNMLADVPESAWMTYWKWWTWLIWLSGIVITIWFSIGSLLDIRRLFADLKSGAVNINVEDDGRVIDHTPTGDPVERVSWAKDSKR